MDAEPEARRDVPAAIPATTPADLTHDPKPHAEPGVFRPPPPPPRPPRDWGRLFRHTVIGIFLLACIAGAGAVAAPLVGDRVDDWLVKARSWLTDPAPVAFGDAVTLPSSIYHPRLRLRASDVVRSGADDELVAVRLDLTNLGDDPWNTALWSKLTLVDKVGYSHEAISAQIRQGATLSSRVHVAPGSTTTGYVVFRVPTGRALKELQFEVSPDSDDALLWRPAAALSGS